MIRKRVIIVLDLPNALNISGPNVKRAEYSDRLYLVNELTSFSGRFNQKTSMYVARHACSVAAFGQTPSAMVIAIDYGGTASMVSLYA